MQSLQSLWMLVAALLFAVMGACVKRAASQYGVAEIVFYRSLLGCVILGLMVRARGGSLATAVPWLHLRRGASGTVSLSLWFFATTVLPLGTAMTLNYASSLYLAAALVLLSLSAGRRVQWPLAATVLIGFIGVLLVLQPSFNAEQSVGAIAGFASGLLSAIAYWQVKELGKLGEPASRTVFYFTLSGVALGLLGTVLTGGFSKHTELGVLLLLVIGLTATFAQLAMTRAYGAGRTLLTANLQYSAIVFASLLGVVLFGDHIAPIAWTGMGVIIASGVLATWFVSRSPTAAPVAPTVAAQGVKDGVKEPGGLE